LENPDELDGTAPVVERFVLLLVALLSLFLVGPLLADQHIGAGILDLFVSLALLLTVRALGGASKRVVLAALTLSCLAIVVATGSHALGISMLLPIGHVIGVVFFLLTGLTLLKRVVEPGAVTVSRLQAAVCGYVLVGLGWGLVYSVIEHVQPGAFLDHAGEASLSSHAVLAGFPHLTYYSFTTLTTLGFGDVVPVSPLARSLSTLEAVVGQLYLAVLVARLVGLHTFLVAGDRGASASAEVGGSQTADL